MQLNSPVSESKIDRLIDTAGLTSGSSVVDFGCGNGDFLIRLFEKSSASCPGIDIDKWDHFEWNFLLKAGRVVISNPDDLELRKNLDRVRAWNAIYR